MTAPVIMRERRHHIAGVRQLNTAAFEGDLEAGIVDALREAVSPLVSLVALGDDHVIGHIMFSPVALSSRPELSIMGLAPMAVLPPRQRQGIGSALVEAGIAECRRIGADAIVVLGHREYYPRFGFTRASAFGLRSEFDVPDDVFMAMELWAGALGNSGGVVRYHAAFGG
jgi:putative acetyltransferase